jgi:hypothetical protein
MPRKTPKELIRTLPPLAPAPRAEPAPSSSAAQYAPAMARLVAEAYAFRALGVVALADALDAKSFKLAAEGAMRVSAAQIRLEAIVREVQRAALASAPRAPKPVQRVYASLLKAAEAALEDAREDAAAAHAAAKVLR